MICTPSRYSFLTGHLVDLEWIPDRLVDRSPANRNHPAHPTEITKSPGVPYRPLRGRPCAFHPELARGHNSTSVSNKLIALTDMLARWPRCISSSYFGTRAKTASASCMNLRTPSLSSLPGKVWSLMATRLLTIRRGHWKFISGQGGGGYDWDEKMYIRRAPHAWNYG